jgi:hypothetical protein
MNYDPGHRKAEAEQEHVLAGCTTRSLLYHIRVRQGVGRLR